MPGARGASASRTSVIIVVVAAIVFVACGGAVVAGAVVDVEQWSKFDDGT